MKNRVNVFVLLFLFSQVVGSVTLQHPAKYKPSKNYTNWVMSEKLDGIRAYWNGQYLATRSGKKIHAPAWFIKVLPGFSLDGELWTERKQLEIIQSIVMDKSPSSAWQSVRYYVFEVPNAKGDFYARLAKLKRWKQQHDSPYLQIIPQYPIKSQNHLNRYFNKVVNKGGEGIIIKNPKLPYFTGRSENSVKRKAVYDMDALVIAIKQGKGKNTNKMGALKVKIASGKVFNIGTGFTDKLRTFPPKIGDKIRFKYYGLSAKGIPKHASFLNIRKD